MASSSTTYVAVHQQKEEEEHAEKQEWTISHLVNHLTKMEEERKNKPFVVLTEESNAEKEETWFDDVGRACLDASCAFYASAPGKRIDAELSLLFAALADFMLDVSTSLRNFCADLKKLGMELPTHPRDGGSGENDDKTTNKILREWERVMRFYVTNLSLWRDCVLYTDCVHIITLLTESTNILDAAFEKLETWNRDAPLTKLTNPNFMSELDLEKWYDDTYHGRPENTKTAAV